MATSARGTSLKVAKMRRRDDDKERFEKRLGLLATAK